MLTLSKILVRKKQLSKIMLDFVELLKKIIKIGRLEKIF